MQSAQRMANVSVEFTMQISMHSIPISISVVCVCAFHVVHVFFLVVFAIIRQICCSVSFFYLREKNKIVGYIENAFGLSERFVSVVGLFVDDIFILWAIPKFCQIQHFTLLCDTIK